MIVTIKYLKCYNASNNNASLLTDEAYRGLHEIICSKCNTRWLVCTIHDLRWSHLRYRIAERHIKALHKNVVVEPNNSICTTNCININYDSTMVCEQYNDDRSYSNDDDSVDNCNISTSLSADNIINKFIECHRPVSLLDYNSKVRRYINSESQNIGDGLKQIVTSAFSMNMSTDYSEISIEEIKYHLKATTLLIQNA